MLVLSNLLGQRPRDAALFAQFFLWRQRQWEQPPARAGSLASPAVTSDGRTPFLPQNCTPNDETEIYLRNFLPELKNFIQGMYRALAPSPKP